MRHYNSVLNYFLTEKNTPPRSHSTSVMNVSITSLLAATALAITAPCFAATTHPDSVEVNWQPEIPRPVYPDKELVDLYEKTWEIAAGRVRKGPEGLPASPYMDENCYEDSIWIWDTSFMALFAKYAPKAFPGGQSLDNFYKPMLEGIKSPLRIWWGDNPPLFAWAEHDNFIMTGDRKHIEEVLIKKQYLLKMFQLFNKPKKGETLPGCAQPVHLSPIEQNKGVSYLGGELGFTWTNMASGMDNTPRGRESGGGDKIVWVDAISQQALSARYISELYRMIGDNKSAAFWTKEFDFLKKTITDVYWDDQDGFDYDIDIAARNPSKVKTIASMWPLMAGVASPQQAKRMIEHLKNPAEFGGDFPCPTLSRDDKDYNNETGDYWRGGIWMPTTYMTVKALERYGYNELADEISLKTVRQILATYKEVDPHTIWECYSPSANLPSTEHGRRARPEFCGWSALGPISLFIENILGFREANAITKTVRWRFNPDIGEHGIKNLKFGDTVTGIVYDGKQNITVESNAPYTLKINGKAFPIPKGKRIIPVAGITAKENSL